MYITTIFVCRERKRDLSIVVCRRPHTSKKNVKITVRCLSHYIEIDFYIVAHFVLLDQEIILSITIERTVGEDQRVLYMIVVREVIIIDPPYD